MNWEDEQDKMPPSPFGQFKPFGRELGAEDKRKRDELMQRQMEALRNLFYRDTPIPAPRKPIEHRTPSQTQSYESLDHFLFQPEIHWNGQTVGHD